MPDITGNIQLRPNEIFASLSNMIISIVTQADNIYETKSELVDMARVDGSMYGDQKIYVATDALESHSWIQDSAQATNVLAIHRPKPPKKQTVILDVFRQVEVTTDEYMSKRAWGTPESFYGFTEVVIGWMVVTKRIYDATTYNAFIGTNRAAGAAQNIRIQLPTDANAESQARLQAGAIAERMANMLVAVKDIGRDLNDYGLLRSYNPDDMQFVWNSEWVSRIEKRDLPTIFHREGLMDKFAQHTYPPRYFGEVNGLAVTESDGVTIRALVETDVTVEETGDVYHVFAGDLIPAGVALVASGSIVVPSYTVNPNIIVKVMHKNSVPYMSAFETASSWFNPKNLSTNRYLTWGHNTLEHLKMYPFMTIEAEPIAAGAAEQTAAGAAE